MQIERFPDRKDEYFVGYVIDVLDAMSLELNVAIESIDPVYRFGVWKQSNSKPRTLLVKLATYRVKKHIFSDKKLLINISLPHKYYKQSFVGESTPNNVQAKIYINEYLTQYR